ncbi:MAG: hypothetical protein JWQ53_2391, partial [Klenkia sp.]|nr:hypothetical protein [Klenkia sp.]
MAAHAGPSHRPLGPTGKLRPARTGAATGAGYADVLTALGELDDAQEELRVAGLVAGLVAAHAAPEDPSWLAADPA